MSIFKPSADHVEQVKALYKDSPIDGIEADKKLTMARIYFLQHFPFFGSLALKMALVEENSIPTMGVDEKSRLYWNRKWVNGLTVKQCVFEIGHEVMHIAQRTFNRKPTTAIHHVWNLASDYYCDTMLIDAGMDQSPISLLMCTPPIQNKTRDLKTIEKMYKFLLEELKNDTNCPACAQELNKASSNQKKQDKKQQDENNALEQSKQQDENNAKDHSHGEGSSCSDEHSDTDNSGPSDNPEHTCGNLRGCCSATIVDASKVDPLEVQKWTEHIINAKEYAEARGKGSLPGNMGAMIDGLSKSTIRWQDHLRRMSTEIFGRGRYTFKRPNRRGFATGVRLPSREPETKAAVVFIDSSGSVSDAELRQTLTEAIAIMDQCGASKVMLGIHDSQVHFFEEVSKDAIANLKFPRGGTSHIEVFEVLNGLSSKWKLPHNYKVEMAVLFTDMGSDFPSKVPSYDVLWGVFENSYWDGKVPFGKAVNVPINS